MSRKDIIIVSVLLNVIVLSILFVLAINSEDSQIRDSSEVAKEIIIENQLPTKLPGTTLSRVPQNDTLNDNKFDLIIGTLDEPDEESFSREEEWSMYVPKPETPDPKIYEEKPSENIIKIVVKKGDSLDRIARANGTTVQSIRALNGLKNDHLKIGQVLNVDVGSGKKIVDQNSSIQHFPNSLSPRQPSPVPQTDPVYYTLKGGDSPWKVAKQFQVNMDELLRLNQLDEEKARNLKVGDKIRVK